MASVPAGTKERFASRLSIRCIVSTEAAVTLEVTFTASAASAMTSARAPR